MEKNIELPCPFNNPWHQQRFGGKMGLSSPTIINKTSSEKQILMPCSVQGLLHTPILCASMEMKFRRRDREKMWLT